MYNKLNDIEDSDFNYEQIGQDLRNYSKYIKEYGKAPGKGRLKLIDQISSLQDSLKATFKRPRPSKDSRAKLMPLEKQFEDLTKQYKAIPGSEEELKASSYSSAHADDLEEIGILERDSLAYQDSVHLKNEELRERKERVDELHKDLYTVNEMFKDAALMIKEQGEDLTVVEKHVDVAAQETGKGVRELVKADGYQKKARKKICIILVIAAVVVGVLIAIIMGVAF